MTRPQVSNKGVAIGDSRPKLACLRPLTFLFVAIISVAGAIPPLVPFAFIALSVATLVLGASLVLLPILYSRWSSSAKLVPILFVLVALLVLTAAGGLLRTQQTAGAWISPASGVQAWGDNYFGKLGDTTTTDMADPFVQVAGLGGTGYLTGVVAVAASSHHSLALKEDGTVWAWGLGDSGQLGNGTTITRQTAPGQVLGSGGSGYLTDVMAISVGGSHSVALKRDGTVWAWGGSCHNGTTTATSTPVQVNRTGGGYLTDVKTLSSSSSTHTFAIANDGSVWGWGWNDQGQVGDGTTGFANCRSSAFQVPGLTNAIAAATGHNFSVVLTGDGSVWTWGSNDRSKLGNGTAISSLTPVRVSNPDGSGYLSNITAIAAGSSHAVALRNDGTVWGWGGNSNGQLGDGTKIFSRSRPVQTRGANGVGYLTDVKFLAVGVDESAIVKGDGSVWAWGKNLYTALFNGVSSPMQMPNLVNATALAASGSHTLVLTPPPAPYDVAHNCALSTPWAGHLGLGVCATFGTFLTQQTDLVIPGRGTGLSLTRTYHSTDPEDAGFGSGWSTPYSTNVKVEPSGNVIVRTGDGRRDRHINDGGGYYIPPAGVYDSLFREVDRTYTLTTSDQFKYRFDPNGRLTSIADRNSNTTTLSYAVGVSLTITEPTGRKFVLSYGTGVDSRHFVRLEEVGALGRTVGYAYDPDTGDLKTVTDLRGNTIQMSYEPQHRLKTITDQEQRIIVTNVYDGQGRVSAQQDAKGNIWSFDYSVPSRTAVDGPRTDVPDTTLYEYDSLYRVTKITDPAAGGLAAGTTEITRDSQNEALCVKDRSGGRTRREIDPYGNLKRLVDAAHTDGSCNGSVATTWEYNYRNDPRYMIDARGFQTDYTYDSKGNLWKILLPTVNGRRPTTIYTRNTTNGDVLSVQDPDGFVTTYGHNDPWGYTTSVTDPAGVVTGTTYDAGGRITGNTAPLGFSATYEYSPFTNPLEIVTARQYPAAGQTLEAITTHNKSGQVATIRDANANITHNYYDANGMVEAVTSAENTGAQATVKYTYDAAGNLKTRTDNLVDRTDTGGRTTEYEYDPLGRTKKISPPDIGGGQGRPITEYAYDDGQRTVTQSGPIAGRATVTIADPLGRPVSAAYPQGDGSADPFTVTYQYDNVGNRTLMNHSVQGATDYEYDPLGRMLSMTTRRFGTTTPVAVTYEYDRVYDKAGDPLNGKTICAKLNYPASGVDQRSRSLLSCPDAAGRLAWVRDWNSNRTDYGYDAAGRLKTVTYPNFTRATYEYDQANRLTEVLNERLVGAAALPAGAVPTAPIAMPGATPRPGAAPRVGTAATPQTTPPAASPPPQNGGRVQTSPRLRTNVAVDLSDPALPVRAYAAGVITQHIYDLDNVGNRESATEITATGPSLVPATTTFDYDAQNRLKKIVYPGAAPNQYEFQYHPNGDRTFLKIDGVQQSGYQYDGAGRLKSAPIMTPNAPSNTYDYDRAGNQTLRTKSTGAIVEEFQYNGAGQLVKHQASSAFDGAWYNGDGLRILRYEGIVANGIEAIWDVNRGLPLVLVEYGPDETTFTIAGPTPIARVAVSVTDEQYLYYHADGLGSTRAITNAQGATVRANDYDAFGAARGIAWAAPGTVVDNVYGFTGEPFDGSTESYYLRARHYDPGTGRFTQADPLGYGGGDNLYAYAGNNPTTLTDPTGLCPACAVVGALWVIAEVGLSLYDAYETGSTLLNPSTSVGEKALTVGFFAAGLVGPGGGYGVARHRFLQVAFDVDIDDIRHASRSRHKTQANTVLKEALDSDPAFRSRMGEIIPDLYGSAASRGNPQGWIWHHTSLNGKMHMQLVPAAQHNRGPLLKRIHLGGKGAYAHRYE